MKYLKLLFISSGYVFILILYLNNDANRNLLGIIFDSFWINCLTVLYFILLHYACKISLPGKYYKIREFEKSGKLYKLIGVKGFKIILSKNPLPTLTAKLSLQDYTTEGICRLEKKMQDAEAVHFQAFLTIFIVMIFFGCFRDSRFFYFMIFFNMIINLYPLLVQRYNRNRIHKIQNLK